MRATLSLLLVGLTLSGCGSLNSGNLNPFKWFGRSGGSADSVSEPKEIRPLVPNRRVVEVADNRALAERLSQLEVNNVHGGILVTATATTQRSGAFNAELVRTSFEGGILTLALRIQYPATATADRATPITVSTLLTPKTTVGIREIRVTSAGNTLSRRY